LEKFKHRLLSSSLGLWQPRHGRKAYLPTSDCAVTMTSPIVEPGRASSATPSKLVALVGILNPLPPQINHPTLLSSQQPPGRSATPKSASGQTPPAKLDDDTIEDVIQRATASAGTGPPPGKDTRTQLFVGNVRKRPNCKCFTCSRGTLRSCPTGYDGKISKICFEKLALCSERTSALDRIIAVGGMGQCC
jgi:hypothetical protein